MNPAKLYQAIFMTGPVIEENIMMEDVWFALHQQKGKIDMAGQQTIATCERMDSLKTTMNSLQNRVDNLGQAMQGLENELQTQWVLDEQEFRQLSNIVEHQTGSVKDKIKNMEKTQGDLLHLIMMKLGLKSM